MPDILSIAEKAVGTVENLAARHYHKKSKRKPAPPLPKAVWAPVTKAQSHYTVGISKQALVPDDVDSGRYYIAGYYGPKKLTGVHDPQCATAIWIDDNSGKGALVLVSVDCVGFAGHDVNAIRARMSAWAKKVGCRAMHFFGTHDHAGIDTMGLWGKLPKSGRDKKFIAFMYDKICAAIEAAYSARLDGSIFFGQVTAPEGYQDDYRLPQVYCPVLSRFRFVPDSGGREIFLVNYAAHPGMLGDKNTLMSADWVHWFRETLYEKNGCEVIFINGLIGGLVYPHEEYKEDPMRSTALAGRLIAELTLSVENERKLEPRISAMSQEFYIPCDNTLFLLAGILKIFPTKMYATGVGRFGVSMKTQLAYFDIGGVHILTVPGEMFPELAYGGYLSEEESGNGCPCQNPVPLLELAGDSELLMFGLGNDELGYIIPPNDFCLHEQKPYFDNARDKHGRKHYEETVSVGMDTAAAVADAFKLMLEAIHAKK